MPPKVCSLFGRGDATFGNPHRAQISQLELSELILLLKLDTVTCRAIRGSSISVNSTLPPLRYAVDYAEEVLTSEPVRWAFGKFHIIVYVICLYHNMYIYIYIYIYAYIHIYALTFALLLLLSLLLVVLYLYVSV